MVATKAIVTMKRVLTTSRRVKTGYERMVSRAAKGMVYLTCLVSEGELVNQSGLRDSKRRGGGGNIHQRVVVTHRERSVS